MAGPAHFRCVIYLVVAALGSAEAPPPTTLITPAPAEVPMSPKLARLFAGDPPKFAPPQPEALTSAAPTDAPRNGIIRLPTYIVREPRSISSQDVMTAQAREDAIVKRYVGEPTGLDMALNKYTLNTLWKKIPLLGRISDFGSFKLPGEPAGPASMSYKDRIVLDYSRIEARRKYLEALGVSADLPPSQPATQSQKAGPSDDAPPSK